jgi:hypothetical protein
MDSKINILKNNFSVVIHMRLEIQTKFDNLQLKITKLKDIHSELLKDNHHYNYTFGLDSLSFQGRLIDVELKNMKNIYILIINRIYCEYYKLLKIISLNIRNYFKEQKILDLLNDEKNILVYRDLELNKEYNFENIIIIHEYLLSILNGLINHYLTKEIALQEYIASNECGLDLNNFVNTLKFENIVLRENIDLYINYLESFHKNQAKNLKRFIIKIRILYNQIDQEINFDSKTLNKNIENEVINDDDLYDENDLGHVDLHHLESNK